MVFLDCLDVFPACYIPIYGKNVFLVTENCYTNYPAGFFVHELAYRIIVTSHWHQKFRIVPCNRVIVFSCNNLCDLSALLSNYGLSHQHTPFRMYMEYGIPRALSFYLFCLYVYIGVGRFFIRTMQGLPQFDW